MPRTPEQIEADEALTAAIERCREVYHLNDKDDDDGPEVPDGPGVTMEYVVIGSTALLGDDGTSYTGVFTIHRDDGVPMHRILGLLEYAGVRWRNIVRED